MTKQFFLTFLLGFLTFCFGQNKLEFKINSINRIENKFKTDYTYEVNYSIKNISSQQVSFFLVKNRIANNVNGSLSNAVIYRFYKDETAINIPIFNRQKELNPIEKEKKEIEIRTNINSMINEVMSTNNPDENYLQYRKKELISQIIILKPNEIITMKYDLNWNKLRNIFYLDDEYYLDENSKYYLDFSIYLLKTPFEKYLSEEEKKSIIQNPNFIEESYTSEKIEIFLN